MEQTPLERAEARIALLEKALRLAWAKYDDNDFCDDSCGDNHGEVEDCYQCWYDYLLRQAEGGE